MRRHLHLVDHKGAAPYMSPSLADGTRSVHVSRGHVARWQIGYAEDCKSF